MAPVTESDAPSIANADGVTVRFISKRPHTMTRYTFPSFTALGLGGVLVLYGCVWFLLSG